MSATGLPNQLVPDQNFSFSRAPKVLGAAQRLFSRLIATLLKTKVVLDDHALAEGANFIFALESYAVVSAPWSLEGIFLEAPTVMYISNDAAAQPVTEGGPNHSIKRPHRAFWFLAG